MRNSKKDADTKNIVREGVEMQLETKRHRSLREEEIDTLYEEFKITENDVISAIKSVRM